MIGIKPLGDRVVIKMLESEETTKGGIIGKVVSIKDETMVIETTKDRTKIRLLRSAVAKIDVKAEDSAD